MRFAPRIYNLSRFRTNASGTSRQAGGLSAVAYEFDLLTLEEECVFEFSQCRTPYRIGLVTRRDVGQQ